MDYKSKNPIPLIWSNQQLIVTDQSEPYDRLCRGQLYDLQAPDGSTDFLLKLGGIDEETGLVTLYGIEAPKGCPMRDAFEWGELSWPDFWMHKGWLLRIIYPFEGGDAVPSYISPQQIDSKTKGRFEKLAYNGPYLLKHEQLELAYQFAKPNTLEFSKAEREYREFMARCGHRLVQNAA